ncbi:MAG TPA: hypothetical protein VKP65_12380, partial [Rhodothermales bacterium]|nr:hypothetical protein [Rhodothermales bacterium]
AQHRSAPPVPDGIISPAETQAFLLEQWQQAEPGSAEARRLAQLIRKVRDKVAQREAQAENPGAFIEALALLKTTRDGRTYAPNYKIQALQQAEARSLGKVQEELPWVRRGPGNISGRARAVIVDVADPSGNTWFAATIGGGVWKTTDAGMTWENKTPDLTTLTTTTIVQAASNPNVFYVGTGMGYGRVVDLEGSGIWKSMDHGETWMQLASTAKGELLEAINRIVVDPTNENIVLACSNDSFSHLGVEEGPRRSGIFRSTDGGASWTQVFDADAFFGSDTDNRVQQIVPDPTNFNNLYATVNEVGVIKSTDGGVTWSVSADNFALPSDVGNPTGGGFDLAGISVRTELAIAPTNPNRIYAAVERPRGVGDLYMSQDAGATWTLVNDTGNDPNWFNSFGASGATGAYTAGWFDNTIAVHPYNENIVFVGGVNVYRFNINPANRTRSSTPIGWWTQNTFNIPTLHADHHFITIIPDNPATGQFRLLDANDGGVAVLTNGTGVWRTTTGMVTTQFYSVDKRPGTSAYIGGMQDNGTWFSGTDPTATSTWNFALGGDGFEAVWNYRDPNLLLGGSQGNGFSRSTDGGQTWQPVSVAFGGFAPFITKIANSKADPDLVFGVASNGVLRSDDFGATWTLTPIATNWLGYRPFDNVEVSNANPQVVWASSRLDIDPPLGARGGIHVSMDGGLSFAEISNNFPPVLRESSGIGTDPVDPNTAYMLFAGPGEPKVMRTTDLGQTWEDISGFDGTAKTSIGISSNGFPDVAAFTLLVMPFDTDILWAGTEIGLFISENGGQTWEYADNGLPQVAIFEMSIVDDEVIVATQGLGIWSVPLPELAGYTPPVVTLAPRMSRLAMEPSGALAIDVDLRSAYDSALVVQDGTVIARLNANAAATDTTLRLPVMQATTVSVAVTAYRDGQAFKAPARSVMTFIADAQLSYANTFDASGASDDFIGNGFSVTTANGFNSPAIHSQHPYGQASTFTYMLKTPIEIGSRNATLTYDDVVLVEEGAVTDYTDSNFFDYVIVEGSEDGTTWLPLIPGYDSRADADWLTAYRSGISGIDSNTPGDASLFVSHSINLLDTFERGDLIFIRFRLFSDPLAVAWGWAIDNLDIQPNAVSTDPGTEVPETFTLA